MAISALMKVNWMSENENGTIDNSAVLAQPNSVSCDEIFAHIIRYIMKLPSDFIW